MLAMNSEQVRFRVPPMSGRRHSLSFIFLSSASYFPSLHRATTQGDSRMCYTLLTDQLGASLTFVAFFLIWDNQLFPFGLLDFPEHPDLMVVPSNYSPEAVWKVCVCVCVCVCVSVSFVLRNKWGFHVTDCRVLHDWNVWWVESAVHLNPPLRIRFSGCQLFPLLNTTPSANQDGPPGFIQS